MAESESDADADADPNAKLTSGPRRVELRSRAGSGSGGRRIRQTDKIRHDQSSQVRSRQAKKDSMRMKEETCIARWSQLQVCLA